MCPCWTRYNLSNLESDWTPPPSFPIPCQISHDTCFKSQKLLNIKDMTPLKRM